MRKFLYSIYSILCYLLLMLIAAPFLMIFSALPQPVSGNMIMKVCRVWARSWFLVVGIRYRENSTAFKSDTPCVFIANHTSYSDIASLVSCIKKPVRVLGRHDISELPIIGYFYKKVVISVDRSNEVSRIESLISLRNLIAEGMSVFVFPEGTFNETDNLLRNFHDGAFVIAINSKVPIQPIIFLDNDDRNPANSMFKMTPGDCRVVFLESIQVEGYSRRNLSDLKERVFRQMSVELDYYRRIG